MSMKDDVFFIIIKKLIKNISINIDEPFSFDVDFSQNHDFINEHYLRAFKKRKNKFNVLKDIFENNFILVDKKKELFFNFYTAQRVCFLLNKFYLKNTYKKYQIADIKTDLFFNSFDLNNDKVIFNLLQNNIIYKFKITDLLRIIESSLIYYELDLDPEPKNPMNPYNNILFSKTNLYNIYFYLKNNNFVISNNFHNFFNCDFNIADFTNKYEGVLRDKLIDKYYSNKSNNFKYNDIILMLRQYKSYVRNLIIHPEFSNTKVIERFECLLPYNLKSKFSFNSNNRIYSKKRLIFKLKKIYNEDVRFGRIYVKCKRQIPRGFQFQISNNNNDIIEKEPQKYSEINLLSPSIPNFNTVNEIINHILEEVPSPILNSSDQYSFYNT